MYSHIFFCDCLYIDTLPIHKHEIRIHHSLPVCVPHLGRGVPRHGRWAHHVRSAVRRRTTAHTVASQQVGVQKGHARRQQKGGAHLHRDRDGPLLR